MLLLLALLLAPVAAQADAPALFDGWFEVRRLQPRCIRLPCPGYWSFSAPGRAWMARTLRTDPGGAPGWDVLAFPERSSTAIRVDGTLRIKDEVATILVRSAAPVH